MINIKKIAKKIIKSFESYQYDKVFLNNCIKQFKDIFNCIQEENDYKYGKYYICYNKQENLLNNSYLLFNFYVNKYNGHVKGFMIEVYQDKIIFDKKYDEKIDNVPLNVIKTLMELFSKKLNKQ